jgi:hypothetical protein
MAQPSSDRTLSQDDWDEFIAVCYFGGRREGDWLDRCIGRAYLDMCRTLYGMAAFSHSHPEWKPAMTTLLKQRLALLAERTDWTADSFDAWHEGSVAALQTTSDGLRYGRTGAVGISQEHGFMVGQAQKWINMSIKYAVALGEQRVPGFQHVYSVAHAPLDRVVLGILAHEGKHPIDTVWSKIDNYGKYMECQRCIRALYPGETALEAEYRIWLQAMEGGEGLS